MQTIRDRFLDLFKREPLMVRSPGRINLIGEHTDYNDGFVLPAAIDREIIFATAKNGTTQCRVFSMDFNESLQFDLENVKRSEKTWPNYILGVVDQLQKAGYSIGGFDCVFGGNIPIGAGLSSSAALECGMAYSLQHLFNLAMEKIALIRYAQKAEHEFAGVQCGIMDQFASVMGKENHAIRLDCRSLEFSYFPVNFQDCQLILCDTQVRHSLASSEYNVRRRECGEGVNIVKIKYPRVESLRDVTWEMLDAVQEEMDPVIYKRCRYVLGENERLLKGCELLKKGDIAGFGTQMYGSHDGLSSQYEVSCKELDFLVDYTRDEPEIIGARMMGGGFGGCTINLVKTVARDGFVESIKKAYSDTFGIALKTYEVAITDGTGSLASKVSL